jgi:quercetin dioxygenase-like cupin family protein
MTVELETSAPYALEAGAGEAMAWFSAEMRLKAASPELGVVEATISPGDEPPLHVHSREDEWFYVLEGEVTFHVGEESYRGTPGTFVSFPRGIAHTFTVESSQARFLVINTPGGFEQMFKLGPTTVEEAVQALSQYGMTVVGPHPRDAAGPGDVS